MAKISITLGLGQRQMTQQIVANLCSMRPKKSTASTIYCIHVQDELTSQVEIRRIHRHNVQNKNSAMTNKDSHETEP